MAEIRVQRRTGGSMAVSATPILLPGPTGGGGLVLMRPSLSWVVDLPLADLTTTLDRLIVATGADAAEVFLAAPTSGELLLAAHQGRAPRAFRQITRFEIGRGFPGLVAQTGEPVLSLDLAHDDRYLRTLVQRQGFRSYLCVPIRSDAGFLGSLHIAFQRHAEAAMHQLPFLAQVARELGWALTLARLRAAEPIAGSLLDPNLDAGTNLRGLADQSLRSLVELARADCGMLLLPDDSSGILDLMAEWGMPARSRRVLARGHDLTCCPSLVQRRCLVRSEACEADSPLCRAVLGDLATALCLPLVAGGKSLGVAVMGFHRREPVPTRRLSLLHAAIDSFAVAIHNAQVALPPKGRMRRSAGPGAATAVEAPTERFPEEFATEAQLSSEPSGHVPFLDLRCLGQFTTLCDQRVLPLERFARRRSLTLLKILLTRYGRQVHREELMELLWPEADSEAAGVLLNVAVHYLRRGLERNAPSGQASSFIGRVGDHYFFNTRSPHRLDSEEFLEAVELGARLERDDRWTEAIEVYQRAIALYAGDFLEDEPYSDWCALQREHLRERFLAVLRRAARLHLVHGNVDAGLACYRRALQADGTLEDVHRALMEALWRAGRRDEALRQYGECRAVLDRELGITPMPETEALRRRIATDRGRLSSEPIT